MLKKVFRDNQEHFLEVFSQASESLQLVFGVEVREVDPRERIYIMVPTLGLTCDAMQSGGQGLPKAGLLILIMWNGDWAPEEVFWGALSKIGLCVGSEHCVFGEPRELLTQVWVQEGYLKYWQMSDNDPACFEFLCGRQACTETSKWRFCSESNRVLRPFPPLSVEAAREEDLAA